MFAGKLFRLFFDNKNTVVLKLRKIPFEQQSPPLIINIALFMRFVEKHIYIIFPHNLTVNQVNQCVNRFQYRINFV
jgi:hypothetical protein